MDGVTITEFILARVAEDEERAKAARGWQTGSRHEGQPLDWSIHMDRWSPDRVLTECEAKRKIVDRHGGRHICEDGIAGERWDEEAYDLVDWPCDDMRTLASIWSDHPDYREEWR